MQLLPFRNGLRPVSRAISEYHHLRHKTFNSIQWYRGSKLQWINSVKKVTHFLIYQGWKNKTFSSFDDKTSTEARLLLPKLNQHTRWICEIVFKIASSGYKQPATIHNIGQNNHRLQSVSANRWFQGLWWAVDNEQWIRRAIVPTSLLERIEGSMLNLVQNMQSLGYILPKLCSPINHHLTGYSLRDDIQCSQVTDTHAALAECRFASVE